MVNHWISNEHGIYWHIKFPNEAVLSNPDILINFAEAFLEICYKTYIFQLDAVLKPPFYHNVNNGRYIESMWATFKETGTVSFFEFSDAPCYYPGRQTLFAPTRLCYYESEKLVGADIQDTGELSFDELGNLYQLQNKVVEADIQDIGALLKQLRPDDKEEYGHYMWHMLPLVVSGHRVVPDRIDVGNKWGISPTLTIKTYSDIWFPFVVDPTERRRVGSVVELFDNRELANCHTPRLNQFLGETYQLAKKYGADWEIETGYIHDKYKPMITKTSILLDL
jgi:hypothetical protein